VYGLDFKRSLHESKVLDTKVNFLGMATGLGLATSDWPRLLALLIVYSQKRYCFCDGIQEAFNSQGSLSDSKIPVEQSEPIKDSLLPEPGWWAGRPLVVHRMTRRRL
jgi:hypothetical protein